MVEEPFIYFETEDRKHLSPLQYSKGGENGIAPVKIAHFPNKH